MRAHGSRSLSIAAAALALAGIAWSTTNPANAMPITYGLVGVTATFDVDTETMLTETLTGNFTFDPTTTTLSAANVFLAGPALPVGGPFGARLSISPIFTGTTDTTNFGGFIDGPNQIVISSHQEGTGIFAYLVLSFSADLGLSADPLAFSLILDDAPAEFFGSFTTGAAVPTPLPAALPLFATGLGGLGLLGWRRKRKNASLVAA